MEGGEGRGGGAKGIVMSGGQNIYFMHVSTLPLNSCQCGCVGTFY